MVYHIQNDCLKIYLTNILSTSANLETAWPYFWGSTFKIGAIFAWWSPTPYSDWKHEMNIFKDLCVTLLNLKKWGLSNFAFQSFKGFIDTLNKKKKNLNSYEGFLKKSHLSTFIHLDKRLDGAWDKFWIKSPNGRHFKWRHLVPKNSKLHAGVNTCHFGIFS